MRRNLTYDPNRDYYLTLGLGANATPDEIRQAYRQCVREIHPDLNPHRAEWATAQLQLINEAYKVLREPALRREYDALRWPHAVFAARPQASQDRNPFGASSYDPDRPWWEQTPGRRSSPPRAAPHSRPRHSAAAGVALWLRAHRLGLAADGWMMLVGLSRSPYASVLLVLSVVLSLNVAFIVYAFLTPHGWESAEAWLGVGQPTAPANTPAPVPTSDYLALACRNPAAAITQPVMGDDVGDAFSVYGSVAVPDLSAYTIEFGYLGASYDGAHAPEVWREVRAAPAEAELAERPIENDLLTAAPVELKGQPEGFYALRLRVLLTSGEVLAPCDVVIRH